MSKKKEKEAPRSGNSETQANQEICDENLDGETYSTDKMVFKLTVPKFGTFMAREEMGPAGEAIVREAIKQIRTVDASVVPLPMEYVFKADASTIFFGSRFETKLDITKEAATQSVLATMAHYGISCLAIARYEDHAQVMYGRGDVFEFMKYLQLPAEREVA